MLWSIVTVARNEDSMLTHRLATPADIPLLADLNRQLVEDERDPRVFSLDELVTFWEKWLASDYQAVIFEQAGETAAYALYRPDEEGTTYLRHFFVCREFRRRGLGRKAMQQLREEIWPPGTRILLEVLLDNTAARQFWRAVGFQDHALVLILPGQSQTK
jgi:GNAT superfamily N-acetyltransferase